MAYFPMFIDIKNKACLVVGGGKVASHKICVLKEFGAEVKVVSPQFSEEITKMQGITLFCKEFEQGDIFDCEIVIAATDSKELNHKVASFCKERGIMVNAVDQIEDCTFIFPSYLKEGQVVAAFSSSGNSPVVTQYLKKRNENIITPLVGSINDFLGLIRQRVQHQVVSYSNRKKVYQKVLEKCLQINKIPSEQYVEQVINDINNTDDKLS